MKNDENRSIDVSAPSTCPISVDEDRKRKTGMGRTLNLSESGFCWNAFPHRGGAYGDPEHRVEDRVVDLKGRPVHVRSTDKGVYEIGSSFIDLM